MINQPCEYADNKIVGRYIRLEANHGILDNGTRVCNNDMLYDVRIILYNAESIKQAIKVSNSSSPYSTYTRTHTRTRTHTSDTDCYVTSEITKKTFNGDIVIVILPDSTSMRAVSRYPGSVGKYKTHLILFPFVPLACPVTFKNPAVKERK